MIRFRALLMCVIAAWALSARGATTPPPFAAVRAAYASSEAVLLDRHGAPLSELRLDTTVRRLDWVPLAEISPAMAATLIAAEDKRFYDHAGVDWSGLAGAAWDSVWRLLDGRRPRGGSTLTMQLASFFDPALAPGSGTRTFGQKWDQARAALALEKTWSKAQILEAYLNLASYRGELTGLNAAARGLFGKSPGGIDAREAAILVALLRNPNAPAAAVAQRACAVAALASETITCEEVRATTMVTLAGPYRLASRWNDAPHVAAKLLKHPGERVSSTLDADLQRFAATTLRDHLAELADRGVGDGAVVVLDNASGDVLAYVGSAGALSSAPQVDGAAALRQPGSTLKPFLYALALDSKLLTAASLVDDSPVAIATARGMYVPQNYDRGFHGLVSVRTALASSLNVPAVRTLELIGVERFHDTLTKLGFDTLTRDDDFYGAALALGDADVTLLSLTNAYRALASGGEAGPPRFMSGSPTMPVVATPRRVFGAGATYIIADVLSDRGARALSFGLENPLATRVWSAAKTGTSKDMRDNWCVGFTSRYTVGVWVGNFSGAPMRDVSGVTGAAPIWRDLVHRLHRTEPSVQPAAPLGIARISVWFDPAVEPERKEWFVRGTEMSVVQSYVGGASGGAESAPLTPRIRYPAADTIIALDPDIPPGAQRVVFEASPAIEGLHWQIDGTTLADTDPRGRVDWAPATGKHTLALVDPAGRMLSVIAFEVRGNATR